MAIEHLVQEHGIERTDIFVAAEGASNTAGDHAAGGDTQAGEPTPESRGDAALYGRIAVSVDMADDAKARAVRATFADFAGQVDQS
ncbi:hypothetical protein [Novosphingobium sp. Leaf2]|uniref:hypothetical protein n=1 Tax=Novosphingobium sp. Leaf2 TaxID=1735670 RepID=UPI001F38FD77|nr:hypothetical protein [Novosphingobium sp. Leaf2]